MLRGRLSRTCRAPDREPRAFAGRGRRRPWVSTKHAGTELGEFLTRRGAGLSAARGALRRPMAAARARPRPGKVAVAWAGEKVGRLKLNGRVVRRSPLSPLVELEAIELGIHGKRLLWLVLREQRPPGSDAVDLGVLITRAERQLGD